MRSSQQLCVLPWPWNAAHYPPVPHRALQWKLYYAFHWVSHAVLNAYEKESGCSVHIVTDEFDEGPVIARAKVKVKKDDTPELLAERILKEEHQLYPKAIQQHLQTL
jgi:folate-dependent phosphoribosylglycinamide formyltransferase PurN